MAAGAGKAYTPDMFEAFGAMRTAREWGERAPHYEGEFPFGAADGEAVVFGVFGDSVGCGLGATHVDRTFAGGVAHRLAEGRRVICRIKAVSGARGRDLVTQPQTGDERFAALSIGTNDLLHGESLDGLERAVSGFLEGMRHAERVVVAGPGDIASALFVPSFLRPILRLRVRACEAALKRAVQPYPNARHLGPSDFSLTLTADHFALDGFHPSERAHALIADAVFSRLIA